MRSAVVFSLLSFLITNVLHAAKPELRGTWLTTTANDAIRSPANTAKSMQTLREIGLNTVYVEVWKNGYTEFPSQKMQRAVGVAMKVNASPAGPALQRDLLQETLIEAHRNQLIYIAWFEYGFMAAHKDTHNELRARRDWLSLDQNGNEVAENGFVWLNPLHPDAQDLLIGIVKEAIERYDLDGVQLDDRIVWPSIEMGYDEFTRTLYAQEHDGRPPPANPGDPEWMAWRQRKVEEFSQRFVREMRAAGGPDLIISLSPGPHPWSMANHLIDWPGWSRWKDTATWDEYITQVYRMNYLQFEMDWTAQVQHIGERNSDLVAGIRLVGDGPDLSAEDVIASAELARQTGSMGHCWWFSRGVLDVYPELLKKYYDVARNGHAPHPKKGADWRPAPIGAKQVAEHKWHAKPPVGEYLVIARRGESWTPVRRIVVDSDAGVDMEVPACDAVELLTWRKK